MNMCCCKPAILKKIKQHVAELRQTINTAFERRDFRVSVFPQIEQRQWLGEVGKQITIRYCLSNISAKNYRNRLMCIEVIVFNISVVF